jgi:hypothetical protein
MNFLSRFQSDHIDARACIDQPANLGPADFSSSNHQAAPAFEFQEHRKQSAHRLDSDLNFAPERNSKLSFKLDSA